MKKQFIYLFVFVLTTLYLLLYTSYSAYAQELSVGVYPPVTKIDALPPVSLHIPLKVQNFGSEQTDVELSLKAFKASSSEDGQVTYLKDPLFPSGNILLFKKITLSESDKTVSKISLLPKEEKEISVDIPVGKNEVPGDYYFSVIFTSSLTTSPATDQQSQSTTTQAGIASHILLSIGPKGPASGKIVQFSSPFFQSEGPVPFTLRLNNTSKNAIAPSGNIKITNMFGQVVGQVELLPVDILSGTTRIIPDRAQITSEGVTNEDTYNKFLSTGPKAIWPEKFLLGFYTANVTLKLTDDGPLLRGSTFFVAIPIQAIIGLTLAMVLTITILRRVRHRLKNSHLRP